MFRFKQFTIHQDRTPMKVGTDGVLLGAWANIETADRILDIGTGTGLIALMSAQRNAFAKIDALEIEENAYYQAKENITASPWGERITTFHRSLQEHIPPYKYNCIICNPPFFNQSTKAPDKGRTLARHNDSLSFHDLIKHTARLLDPYGTFCTILPVKEALTTIQYGQEYALFPQHITRVYPTPTKPVKRFLIEFSFQEKTCREEDLIIEFSRHQYSPEYTLLTDKFYLK